MDVGSILQGDWKFRIEHKGIKIYSSKVNGSDIHGFKGEAEIEVSLKKLISLFHDMPSYNRWVHHLVDMQILDNSDPRVCCPSNYQNPLAASTERGNNAHRTHLGR